MHFGFDHLVANTLPLLVLGFLAALRGTGRFLAVAFDDHRGERPGRVAGRPGESNTAGASGPDLRPLRLSAGARLRGPPDHGRGAGRRVVAAVYGSILWGVLPTDGGISWQGHLFGLIGGVLAAFVTSHEPRARRGEAGLALTPVRAGAVSRAPGRRRASDAEPAHDQVEQRAHEQGDADEAVDREEGAVEAGQVVGLTMECS